MDNAKIQEEQALKSNQEKLTKQKPALTFYIIMDAEKTIPHFEVEVIYKYILWSKNVSYRFQCNGRIIPATFIKLNINGKRFVFSGDIGRCNDYLLNDHQKPECADFFIFRKQLWQLIASN